MKEVHMWTISENKEWAHLERKRKFGWVERMKEVPQDAFYHAEGNVAVHTQMVLAALCNEDAFKNLDAQEQEVLWAAALLHDVEKYSTTMIEEAGRVTSPGHARKGALTARRLLYQNESPAPFEIREQIVGLIRYHGLPIWIFEKPDPLKALVKASMEVNMQWLALLARADMHGRICGDKDEMLYRIDCFEAYCREHDCWNSPRYFSSPEAKVYYMSNDLSYLNYVPFDLPSFEVVLMSGLPGAGKDTFIKKNFKDVPVVSLDTIRNEWGIKPTDKSGNGKVIQEAKERARVFLRKKQSFVWNATNITQQMRVQLTDLFVSYKAEVNIVYLEVPYKRLYLQNRSREAQVPDMVLDK
ncbi:AAA family ATPase [Pedobacter sp. NJ-S-72]